MLMKPGSHRRVLAVSLGLAAGAIALTYSPNTQAADRTVLNFPGERAYPESITSTSDGTLFTGSPAEGGISRILPGTNTAERWIPAGANDSMSTLGVLADERSETLWVCSSNLSGAGVPLPAAAKPVALKRFDLKTGQAKGSYSLPGEKTFCNDMAVGAEGSVYVTDSLQPHILRLKPGAAALEVWAEDPRFGGEGLNLNGIAVGADGNMYVDTYSTGRLFRIDMEQAGKAGRITQLETSQPLDHPDGMRSYGPKSLLVVEGAGRFDIVHLDGDAAKIDVVKDGFKVPVSVVQAGNTAWVLEAQLNTLFDPNAGNPGPFHAYAVSLPK
jgi:streptogramin lyase